ncbi:MAG: hypothetical protein ACLP9K_10130 [Nitrososphaerales archaeon]|jgi:hypothetical protein
MKTRTAQLTAMAARCGYCGKKLVVQHERGENADGNIVVLETDGSRKRACRGCADRLSMDLSDRMLQSQALSRSVR